MYAYVGICHDGKCAFALGINSVEAVIENIKNIAIAKAILLLFAIFNLSFLSYYLFCLKRGEEIHLRQA
jgi:hypothetical protein